MDKFPLSWTTPHVHAYVDPDAPLAHKHTTMLEIIGDGPREMRGGHTYRCRKCGEELTIPERFKVGKS